MKPYAPARDPF